MCVSECVVRSCLRPIVHDVWGHFVGACVYLCLWCVYAGVSVCASYCGGEVT